MSDNRFKTVPPPIVRIEVLGEPGCAPMYVSAHTINHGSGADGVFVEIRGAYPAPDELAGLEPGADEHRERAAAAITTLREAIDGLYAKRDMLSADEGGLVAAMERASRQLAGAAPDAPPQEG